MNGRPPAAGGAASTAGLAALSLLFLVLLARHVVVLGSNAGNWAYPYTRDLTGRPFAVALVVILVAAALLWWTVRLVERHEVRTIGIWLAAGLGGQLLLQSLYPFTVEELLVRDPGNAYLVAAGQHGPLELISRFEELAPRLPFHGAHNMPGKILFFHALELVTPSPATMAYLVLVISNLGGALLYWIAVAVFRSRLIALYSLVLYLLVPARQFFFPLMNTISPVVVLMAFAWLALYLNSRRVVYLLALGATTYAVLFFDPLAVAALALFGPWLACELRDGRVAARDLSRLALHGAAGFAAVYGLMLAMFGFEIVGTLARVGREAAAFNAAAGRPYGPWLYANVTEFFVASGVAQSAIVLAAAIFGAARLRRRRQAGESTGSARRHEDSTGWVWAVGLLATVLVLDVAGVNRGEVTRLWIFLAVFVQMIAAYYCVRKLSQWAFAIVLAATILQTSIALSTVTFIEPR